MNAATDIVVQALGSFADPLAFGVGILVLVLSFSALLVRAAMAATALATAGLEQWDGGLGAWDAALLGGSLAGSLLASQLVLYLVAPMAWLGMRAARTAIDWWRNGR
ncbi:MAG: hypothetical protein AB7G39_07375 [Alphaproteobacteria bacterium]